jgi:hypothetical protein
MHDTEDRDPLSAGALLRTMAIAALLAATASACNKSMDNPVTPQPPRPHAEAAGAKLMHAIYQSDGRRRAFFIEGEKPDREGKPRRLVIRT